MKSKRRPLKKLREVWNNLHETPDSAQVVKVSDIKSFCKLYKDFYGTDLMYIKNGRCWNVYFEQIKVENKSTGEAAKTKILKTSTGCYTLIPDITELNTSILITG